MTIMRNHTLNINNRLFESILDDVEQTDVNVSSLRDNISDDDKMIDYERYQYEVRIYFTREVFYYDKLVKEQLPKLHEQLNLILENSKLFSAVSPVRIFTPEIEKVKEFADEPIIRDWTEQINSQWPYYAWTAVFCCDMLPINNIRRFINFIGAVFSATFYNCSSSGGCPMLSFRKDDIDYVTFWPAQMSYAFDVMKNTLNTDKKHNKKRSEYLAQFYLQFIKLSSSKSGIEIAQTLTNCFKIDWSQILFEKTLKQYIREGNFEKSGQRNVKLSNTTKNFLSTLEVSTEMFERMGNSLQVYSFKFTDTSIPDQFYINGTTWRPVKTLWGEAAKRPLSVLSWEMKTIDANLDYVLMIYLGLFDCSEYMKTTEEKDNPEAKSEPVHLVLVSGGEIEVNAIETKFRELLGNRFLHKVCDDITEALFANANHE